MLLLLTSFAFIGCEDNGLHPTDDTNQAQKKINGEELFRGLFLLENDYANRVASLAELKDVIDQTLGENPEIRAEFKKRNDELVEKVSILDPTLFERLANAVVFRNATALEKLMDDTNEMLAKISMQSYAEQYPEIRSKISGIDPENYDLKSQEGLTAYLSEIEKALGGDGPTRLDDEHVEGRCITVWFVLAAAVWDVAAVYNYGALVNVGAAVLVYAYVYAEYKFWPKEIETALTNGNIATTDNKFARESYIAEIMNIPGS